MVKFKKKLKSDKTIFRRKQCSGNSTRAWTILTCGSMGIRTYIHLYGSGGGATWGGETRYLAASEFSSVAGGGY